MNHKLIRKHLQELEDRFPKLRHKWSEELKSMLIYGEMDICDIQGAYWDTFEVSIVVGTEYPYSVPIVMECSDKIPRIEERHISKDGECCIDMEHRLLKMASSGINICTFVTEKVYSFFANQLYYEEKGDYANGEWPHHFDGIRKFYAEELRLLDTNLIIDLLQRIINNELPGRNQLCPCQEMKYKKCFHKDSVDFLMMIKKTRLTKDLEGFKSL